jgi:hypothetical protein
MRTPGSQLIGVVPWKALPSTVFLFATAQVAHDLCKKEPLRPRALDIRDTSLSSQGPRCVRMDLLTVPPLIPPSLFPPPGSSFHLFRTLQIPPVGLWPHAERSVRLRGLVVLRIVLGEEPLYNPPSKNFHCQSLRPLDKKIHLHHYHVKCFSEVSR